MTGKKHSKEMLTEELRALRRRVAELEREKYLQGEIEKEKATAQRSLRERIKELNCLFGVAEVIERYGSSLEKILQGISDLLPDSLRYPEITCARVIFEDNDHMTSNFLGKKGVWWKFIT
jgi:hypothetical protein